MANEALTSLKSADNAGNQQPKEIRDTTARRIHFASDSRAAPSWAGIGDVSHRFNVTARALRFYESKGLLSPRREGTSRWYDAVSLIRLELILKGKQLGFTLAEIRAMLAAHQDDSDTLDLPLTAAQLLQQIGIMEKQMRETEIALGELRRRYYLMNEVSEGAQLR